MTNAHDPSCTGPHGHQGDCITAATVSAIARAASVSHMWKVDPVSAGTAYGTLGGAVGYLHDVRQAVKDGRTGHALAMIDQLEAHIHLTLAKVSANPGETA